MLLRLLRVRRGPSRERDRLPEDVRRKPFIEIVECLGANLVAHRVLAVLDDGTQRTEIVALNKLDLIADRGALDALEERLRSRGCQVLRTSGALGGYHWGTTRKRAMIAWESANAGLASAD